ncbi:hypothetical protein [Sutcliffiella cohnii]|uniref:Uncharacterized protein n=1 Tax=Sutcliffiella cohnii TaxID=33932 RepID=A0A223KNW8_9BACI|nr:hypothetical protein [Sutcliffiella cohnii]AST91048.1 hypothetical protein BC6307_07025 [Sutcliffiella cohnii]
MPAISKIRLTNVVYEEGNKRYNDELFLFEGHNGAILLENGGGKTVLIQTALQAILPHVDLADRKIKNTLQLENAPAHIAIEWIMNDQPRRYVVTAVTLFMTKNGLDSYRYVYEYDGNDPHGIEGIPFVRGGKDGKRTADRGEMLDYYSGMRERSFMARTFPTIKEYKTFIEEQYHIISSEWESIVKINSSEGGVEAFFDDCKTTNQLFDRLLIPTVERSINGHEENMFADLFEKQHTSFKNYKKLKETLEENKQIQSELEEYVSVYEKLHQREKEYEKAKQRTKGTWTVTIEQQTKATVEHAEVLTKLEEWNTSETFYQVKSASYEILIEELTLKRLEEELKEVLGDRNKKEEELHTNKREYFSLKLSDLKARRKEKQDSLKHIEEELASFEQTDEVNDFEEKLEIARQELRGFYMEEEERLENQRKNVSLELNPIINKLEGEIGRKQEIEHKERDALNLISSLQSKIETRTNDLQRLKNQLLANPTQEDMKEEMEKWTKRQQYLDDEIISFIKQEKEKMGEIKVLTKKLEENQLEKSRVENKQNNVNYQLDQFIEEQKHVIKLLSSLRPQWASIEKIHLQEEAIRTRLEDEITKRKKERDQLLYRERIAYRYVDDYDRQDQFFGDAFLEEKVQSWKNQFDYVVTGVEYVQSMNEKDREKYKQYPLWPLTLVTTNKSKEALIGKIRSISDQLQFPIVVITTEEAVEVQEESANYWVSPSHWGENIELSTFTNWKKEIKKSAFETTAIRELKEQEIKVWEECLHELTKFLEVNPYKKIFTLEEEKNKLSNLLQELAIMIQKVRTTIAEHQSAITVFQTTINNYRDEKQGLGEKISKAMDYLHYERELEEDSERKQLAEKNLQHLQKDLTNCMRLIEDFENQKRELQDRKNQLGNELILLKREEAYPSVQSFTPIFTGKSKQVLLDKIQDLKFSLEKINRTKGEWIAKREGVLEFLQSNNDQINDLLKEQQNLDEDMLFPGDGKQRMSILFGKIEALKVELENANRKVQEKASEKDKQLGLLSNRLLQFKKDYPSYEIVEFAEGVEKLQSKLLQEQQHLKERKSFLDQEKARMEKQVKELQEAKYSLDLFIEGHHFNAPDVEAVRLNDEELNDFTYSRKKFIKAITDQLRLGKAAVENEKETVARAKRKFREFCNTEISDVKLRQMALTGIEVKQSYDDILEFKRNMLQRIERVTVYANEHIRQSDEDMQLFVTQIHTHLLTLTEELKQIPKKTKVKIVNDWKQIFNFNIPEWDEEIGKTRILDYIEWILQQLESDRFYNDQGEEDAAKIRKDIEMWLQSKQLLQIVMNNEVMKVSCRKVTNDNKVTTRSYSWEQSNVWSGGEKWSKNMTLFLGILNYVAEKRQHIQSNMKRHRAVILDNPFGKASSDHVLSPVFFIAEQLGFQIIALTAHAEGKFLQDYFPIIYSCRLRASTDSSKKVMTKEKWLHHAYFQDHEPVAMERLGEVEQMSLFE